MIHFQTQSIDCDERTVNSCLFYTVLIQLEYMTMHIMIRVPQVNDVFTSDIAGFSTCMNYDYVQDTPDHCCISVKWEGVMGGALY